MQRTIELDRSLDLPSSNMTALSQLMRAHKLKDEQVAIILNRSACTIARWRRGTHPMPVNLMELLTIKLQAGSRPGVNIMSNLIFRKK